MEIIRTIEKLNTEKKTAVAVGYFDGMHLGHQELVCQMMAYANSNDLIPTILTFDMHALRAVGKGKQDLFPRAYTLQLAKETGVEIYADLPFEKIRELDPDRFAQEVLGERFLHADAVFCGTEFRYGKDRAGTTESLLLEGKSNSFSVHVVESVTIGGEVISTTKIKELVKEGRIREANRMLGKPYSICGEVVHGNHLAQGMGFATANIEMPDDVLSPPKGVYLTQTIYNGERFRSITNIGTRPTITDDIKSTAETHILDFHYDIYGKNICVLFHDFIRPEQRFDSVEQLKKVVKENIAFARNTNLAD